MVGVAEDLHVLSGVSAIVQAAGKRTLYTYGDIKRMAESGTEVLVIGFRQARVCEAPVSYRDLRQHGVLRGAPQAVTAIREEAATWLAQTLRL